MAKTREVKMLPTVHEETEEDEQQVQARIAAYYDPYRFVISIGDFMKSFEYRSLFVDTSNPGNTTPATAVPITSHPLRVDRSVISINKSSAFSKVVSLTSNSSLLSVLYPVPQYNAQKITTVADLIDEAIEKLQNATATNTVAEQIGEAIKIAEGKQVAKMPIRKREASDAASDATRQEPMFKQEFLESLIPNNIDSPMTREIFKTNASLLESLDMEVHIGLLKGLNAHYIARYRKSKTGTAPVRDLIDEAFETASDVKLDTASTTKEFQDTIMGLEEFTDRVLQLAETNNRNWEEALKMVREANKPAKVEDLETGLDEYKLSQESANGDSVGEGAKGEKKKKKKNKKKSKKGGKGKQGMEAESQDVATTALDDAYAAVEAKLAAI